MSNSVDIKGYQREKLGQWIAEPNSWMMDRNKQQLISNKTNLLARAQDLAAESKAILLSELDHDNYSSNEVTDHDFVAPSLAKPAMAVKLSKDKVTELLSKLMMLSSDINLSDLSTQLSKLISSYESCRRLATKLDEDFETHIDLAESLKKELSGEEHELNQLRHHLDEVKAKVADKQRELARLDKNSPAYKEVMDSLHVLQNEVVFTEQAIMNKNTSIRDKVIAAEASLKEAAEVLKQQGQLVQQNSVFARHSNGKKGGNNAARLSQLLTFFMQLIGKNSENQLKAQMSIFESMQKSVQKQMSEKAKEMEVQQKKSEELQYTMGCIGKIIGALITVVSVVSATFTGGSSLALAGVGLALMTGDVVTEAATGQSLTDRLMEPFMQYVFLPLMGVIEKVVDKVLAFPPLGQILNLISEITGTDITGIAKTAISALVTIAVIVAVAYLAKGAVQTVTKKLLGSTVSEAIKNIIPEVVTDLVKQVAHSIEKALMDVAAKVGIESKSTALRALQLQKLMQYVSFSNQGAQVTSNVFVANFKEQATKALASFKLSQTDLDNVKKVLESVVSSFENSQDLYRDLTKLIASSIQNEAKTGKQVLALRV